MKLRTYEGKNVERNRNAEKSKGLLTGFKVSSSGYVYGFVSCGSLRGWDMKVC